MKGLFLFSLIAVHIVAAAASAGQVLGVVFDKVTGKAAANAQITFENSMDKITVQANEYGHYYADHMPTGRYEMRVAHAGKTFVLKRINVYDGYTTEVNFPVSSEPGLPAVVEVVLNQNRLSSVENNNVNLSNSDNKQPTRQLSEALSMQPGVDVRDGKVMVKGSDQVKFFIDGTPVLGQPRIDRIW